MKLLKSYEHKTFSITLFETDDGMYSVEQTIEGRTTHTRPDENLSNVLSIFDTMLETFRTYCH